MKKRIKELKKECLIAFNKGGKKSLQKYIGNTMTFPDFVLLGNSFLIKKDRKEEYINYTKTEGKVASEFIADRLIKEYEG